MTHAAYPANPDPGLGLRKHLLSLMSPFLSAASGTREPVPEPGSERRSSTGESLEARDGSPDSPERNEDEPPADERAEHTVLESLRRGLEELSARFDRTGQELARYLSGKRSPPGGNDSAQFSSLAASWMQRLDEFGESLKRIESGLTAKPEKVHPAPDSTAATGHLEQLVQRTFDEHQARMAQVQAEIQAGFQQILKQVEPKKPAMPASAPPVSASVWSKALFGDTLAADSELTARLARLCERLLSGDAASATFVGQLLIYRYAAAERRPQLLKDIGEAYYRCFPKQEDVEDRFEQSFAAWLQGTCEQAGFQNRIELVQPGERFDATRHAASGKGGVEVAQVQGWVVLRDRDKVYTKALVSLQ